jgi:hypothetical protein
VLALAISKHLPGLGPSPIAAKTDLHRMGNCILQAHQAFVHVENNAVDVERKMTFQQGVSGNLAGNRHHTRHLLNQKFMQALLLDFEAHGREAIEKCRKQSALGYVKVLGHLVPREMKVEHSQSLKSMSDEELEAAIEYVRAVLAAHAGEGAKVIEGAVETAALPAPAEPKQPQRKRPNRLLEHVDTSVGPKERKPRKRVPSPVGA